MEVLGFNSPKQLNAARSKAMDAGWLVYQRDNTRSVGHYWTTAPDSVNRFDDSPIEPIRSDSGKLSDNGTVIHSPGGTHSGTRSGMHCGTQSGKPSNPSPVPVPNALKSSSKHKSKGGYSAAFEDWYRYSPRKTSKRDAAKAFDRAVKRIEAQRSASTADARLWLNERTELFAKSVRDIDDPKYIPYPA